MPDQKTVAPYQPNKRTVGELLSTTRPQIVVPPWQRSYSWSLPLVETFWSDLKRFKDRYGTTGSQYFLGSVVIVETTDSEHLLLDGQQRLATSAILLSAIRDQIKSYKEDAAHRVQARYLADFNDAKNSTVYKLTLNSYDSEFFKREILEWRDASFTRPDEKYPSHGLIRDARNFFENVLREETKALNPQDAFQWCLEIQALLTDQMTLIAITSTDEDSAAEVFETLNDRGIGLSTPDLLRNLVMRRAAPADRDTIVELWGNVLEFGSDVEIKTFIRHYWISWYGDVKTQSLYREIKEHIEDKNIPSLKFSRALSDAADVYREILDANDPDPEIAELLEQVASLGASASILLPFLLSIQQSNHPPDVRLALINHTINVFFRHSVIAKREGSRLENVLYKAARDLRAGQDAETVRKAVAAIAPDDEEFAIAFSRAAVNSRPALAYLLRKLEHFSRPTEELKVSTPKKVHVEHIYPQTPLEGARWPNHEQMINRIGNVTLLSQRFNTSLKNADFEKKRVRYALSDIVITRALADVGAWDAAAIQKRQDELSKIAVKLWPIE